jgi:hypothetical protein
MTDPLYVQKLEMLPADARGRILRYIKEGFGSSLSTFYRSLLSNDLIEAWKGGDAENRAALGEFVEYLSAYAPEGCYGSPEKVANWRGVDREPVSIVEQVNLVETMRAALKPFAQIADGLPVELEDAEWCEGDELAIQAGSFRRAKDAYEL